MPSSSASNTSKGFPWHAVAIGALTIAIVAIFLSSFDLKEAWRAVLRAHVGLIAAATAVTLQTYVLRAWRWQLLLRPIGPTKFRNAFSTTVIGYAANFLLPARVGEVLRPYLLARRDGLDPAAAFATIIVERLLDLVMVLSMFAFALFFAGLDVGPETKAAGLTAAGAAAAGLVALFVLAGHPDRLARISGKATGRLPAGLRRRVEHLVQTFAQGLGIMRNPAHLAASVVLSVPLWCSLALGIWLTSLAFDLTMPFVGSFLVVGYLTVGIAAPLPGGAGGFHGMYLLAMTTSFNADKDAAGAAAIVLHLVSFVPVTLMGLWFMWQDGLSLGRLKGMRAEAEQAETPHD